jgi:DNA-directed RNA polymerase specialized sigma subunit
MPGYTSKDTELWKEWKRNPTSYNMDRLLRALNPVIQSEINRWSGVLSRGILETKAKRLAVEAIKTYSPTHGAALGTHVVNRLKKLSRTIYTHQNVARIPEYQVLKYRTYSNAILDLENELGRPPATDEVASRLNWSKNMVERMRRSVRKEFVESGDPVSIFDQNSGDGDLISYMYHDMNPEQKMLFEHTTGYGGAKILDNDSLRRKLKVTQGQLSYKKRQLVDMIKRKIGGVS